MRNRRDPQGRFGCHRVKGLFSAYLDDRLGAIERDGVRYHTSVCEPCRKELESLAHTVHLVRRLPAAPVPRGFRLAENRQGLRQLNWLQRARLSALPRVNQLGMATAAALVLLAGSLAVDLTGLLPAESDQQHIEVATITPETSDAFARSAGAVSREPAVSAAPDPSEGITHIPEATQAPRPSVLPDDYTGIAGKVNETGEVAPTPVVPLAPGPDAIASDPSSTVSPATVLEGEELLQKDSNHWIRPLEITLASLVAILGSMSLWIRQGRPGSASRRKVA